MHRTDLAILRQGHADHRSRQTETMAAGPHLDGHTLIIPSVWYNEQAAKFWRQYGFQYNRHASTWERDTRLPLRDGKHYTAKAWLTSTRQQFHRFWPRLKKTCRYCRRKFIPRTIDQFTCPSCESATDTERNYRRGLR